MSRADPREQALTALLALGIGILLALCYELVSALRVKLSLKAIQLFCDLLFAFFCTLVLFLMGSIAGGGELRLFMPLLMLLGGLLYLAFLRRPGTFLVSLLLRLLWVLCFPLRLLLHTGKNLLRFQKNLFHYFVRWFTIGHQAIIHDLRKDDPYEAQAFQPDHQTDYSGPPSLHDHYRFQNRRPRRKRKGSEGGA